MSRKMMENYLRNKYATYNYSEEAQEEMTSPSEEEEFVQRETEVFEHEDEARSMNMGAEYWPVNYEGAMYNNSSELYDTIFMNYLEDGYPEDVAALEADNVLSQFFLENPALQQEDTGVIEDSQEIDELYDIGDEDYMMDTYASVPTRKKVFETYWEGKKFSGSIRAHDPAKEKETE